MSKETTTVETVDMDLDAILNPGDSVMLPSNSDKAPEAKASIFSRNNPDLSFLDKPIEKEPEPAADSKSPEAGASAAAEPKATPVSASEIDEIINTGDEIADSKKAGRPKTDKDGLMEIASKLIEKKLIVPFEDENGNEIPLESLTLKDFEELFAENFQEKERKVKDQFPAEFFQSLPEELQYAAKYVADGGQDLRSLFRVLGEVEETRQMDPANENDARNIVRGYLQATNFGSAEDIEEELNGWEDRGELEAKAKKFKPKLDAMAEQQVAYKLQQQEQFKRQQQEQAQHYMNSLYSTLEPGDLNGIKLDKKTQNLLFTGLVRPDYPSVNGRPTNLLGHLLEKYQFVEPNHGLVAEALWLLADPDGYKNKVREATKKEVVTETVRKLKSEEGRKIASHVDDHEESRQPQRQRGIPRPSSNFFKR